MPGIPATYRSSEVVGALRASAASTNDYRALVCVFLFGGADAHNIVVPRQGTNRAVYDAVRGANAITLGTELPLNADWGLHPNLATLKTRFDAGQLAVVLNVGFMKEPTTRSSFLNKSVRLPEQLFSHNSQQLLWQALPAQRQLTLDSGWMGRIDELAGGFFNPSPINDLGSCFSVAGRVLQMQGYETNASVMQTGGAVSFTAGEPRTVNSTTFANALASARTLPGGGNILQSVFSRRSVRAISNQSALAANLAALPTAADNRYSAFTSNSLAMQLKIVARIIHSRAAYGHRRDLFFVSLGGWDNHSSLNAQLPTLLTRVNDALGAFFLSLEDLGLGEYVTAFTASDFGRTLVINATGGSDHGWGGHHFVLGGAVNGGVYGSVDLTVNGPMDAGQGRLVPTTSVEQMVGGLVKWWGVPEELVPTVLENTPSFAAPLPLVREPVSALPAPALSLDLMQGFSNGGQLPEPLTNTRDGPRTWFDETGRMRMVRQNLCVNSANFSAVQLGVFGAGGAFPNTWLAAPGAGFSFEVVGQGQLDDGAPYVDFRMRGSSSSLQYSRLWFSSANAGSRVPVKAGARMVASATVQVISGSLNGISSPGLRGSWLNGSTSTGDWSASGLSAADYTIPSDGTMRRLFFPADVPSSGSDHARFGLYLSTPVDTEVDVTLRVSKPALTYVLDGGAVLGSGIGTYRGPAEGDYVPTVGSKVDGPLFDYDPRTLKPLGVVSIQSRTNFVANSTMQGAAIGTPGTLPSGWAVDFGAITGLLSTVVDAGSENGMPYVDIRFAGNPSANGGFHLYFRTPASPASTSANTHWCMSAYLALKNGALPSGATANRVRLVGAITGTPDNESNAAHGNFNDLTDGVLSHRRVQAPLQISASGNQAYGGLFFPVTAGQLVDFTIRIGAPQMESGARSAGPFIPTFGNTVNASGEDMVITGATFASFFNPAASTVAVKFAHDVDPQAAAHFPKIISFGDGTPNNRFDIYIGSTGQTVGGNVTTGGSTQGDVVPSGARARRAVHTVAQAVALNDHIVAVNGQLGTQDTTVTLPTGINNMRTGANNSIGGDATIWTRRIDYFNSRLSDANLSLLSSQ